MKKEKKNTRRIYFRGSNKHKLLTIVISRGHTADYGGEEYDGWKNDGNVARGHACSGFRWWFADEQWKSVAVIGVSGLLYTEFVTIASFSSFSFVLCLAFHHPCICSSAAFRRLGGVSGIRDSRSPIDLYDCHGVNPMIARVRSGAGLDVILKVISSHLIRFSRRLGRSRAKG